MHRQLSRTPVHLCWSVCGIISWSWSTGQRRCPPRWHNGPSGATCASGSTITVTSTSYFGGAQAAPAGELLVHTRHSTKRPHTISTCFGRSLDCHQVGAPLPYNYLEKLQRRICASLNSMHSKGFKGVRTQSLAALGAASPLYSVCTGNWHAPVINWAPFGSLTFGVWHVGKLIFCTLAVFEIFTIKIH